MPPVKRRIIRLREILNKGRLAGIETRRQRKLQRLEQANTTDNGNRSENSLDHSTPKNSQAGPHASPPKPVQLEPLPRLRPKKSSSVRSVSSKIIQPRAPVSCESEYQESCKPCIQSTWKKCSSKRQELSKCFICGVQQCNTQIRISRLSCMLTRARAVASTFTHLISGKQDLEKRRRSNRHTIFKRIEDSYFCKTCGNELNNVYKMHQQLIHINKKLRSTTNRLISQIKLNFECLITMEDSGDAGEMQEQNLRQDILAIATCHEDETEFDFGTFNAYYRLQMEDAELECVNFNPEEVFLSCDDNSSEIKTEEDEDEIHGYSKPDFNLDPLAFESIEEVESKIDVKNLRIQNIPFVPKQLTQTDTLKEVFICKLCDDRVFISAEEFQAHDTECPMKIPDRRCDICGLEGFTAIRLKNHFASVHSNRKRGHCEVCGKLANDLKAHHVKVHQTDFTCSICDCHFDSYLVYNYHRTTHPELKLRPVKCEQCGKILVSNKALRRHQSLTHEKTYPVICEICGWGTRSQTVLREHIRSRHENTRDFVCDICDVAFARQNALSYHLKRHRGEVMRKYKCSYCSKAFTSQVKRRDHEAAVHVGELKYSCEHCGKRFPIKNYLYVHLRSHETPEQKEARRLKAKQNAEARRLANKPVLIPKGRPRVKGLVS